MGDSKSGTEMEISDVQSKGEDSIPNTPRIQKEAEKLADEKIKMGQAWVDT